MKSILAKPSYIAFLVTAIYVIWLCGNIGKFASNQIHSDVSFYYHYTPAALVKHDLTLSFLKDSSYYNPKEDYFPNTAPNGNLVIKSTYGMSLMYLPFTIWPYITNADPDITGFEQKFSNAITISTLFYFVAGLFLLIKLLRMLNFTEKSIALSVFCVGMGTNFLSYGSVSVGMSHVPNFFLIVILMINVIKWYKSPVWKYSLIIGLCMGLLILNRPTNMIFIICFLLYGSYTLKDRINLYLNNKIQLALMAIPVILLIIPQLYYWKVVTGHYFFNSYVGERFFFTNPHLIDYLFGFRKGWFIYTPIIILAFVGLFKLRNQNPFFVSTLIIISIMIYLNSSWWSWWFGGGHGARAMIECYPLLSIGFAALLRFDNAIYRKIIIGLSTLLILFNIKSSYFYRVNVIHYDSMTAKAYFYTMFKIYVTDEEQKEMEKWLVHPDTEKARRGEDT